MLYNYSYRGRNISQFPGGGLGCLLTGIILIMGGYYLLKGVYFLLLWAAPALLVLALIINWRVFPDAIKSWLKSLEDNPLEALLTLAFVVLAFPFFSLYMFLKALGYRKMEQLRQEYGGAESRQEDGFTDFEELESHPLGQNPEAPEELNPPSVEPEKVQPKKEQNPYDSFFG